MRTITESSPDSLAETILQMPTGRGVVDAAIRVLRRRGYDRAAWSPYAAEREGQWPGGLPRTFTATFIGFTWEEFRAIRTWLGG